MENKIYVGNLDWNINDEKLLEVFKEFGEVVLAQVIIDRETGRSRGFGFVTFKDEKSTKEAMDAMNGQYIDKRQVIVKKALPEGTINPVSSTLSVFINTAELNQEFGFKVEEKHFVVRRDL